jgi:peptidoglycan hydrolase FlgJ
MNLRLDPPNPAERALATSVRPSAGRTRAGEELALRQSAEALEGLFVQQLFQAMRASVPTDGLLERGAGEDLFGSMLDQTIATDVAQRDQGARDLSVSLFAALRDRLGPPADTAR